jgi:hypothetical protein
MTKPVKRPNSGAPGVKLLLTAASLAATLGGWAVLSGQQVKPAPAPAPEQAAAPVVTIKLAPLPTLVPPVTPRPRLGMVNQPRPAAAAPQPAPSNELVLRDISAPALPDRSAPPPAANSRSSR